MTVVIVKGPEIADNLSREIEYWTRRGLHPVAIEISPEAHEAMRLRAKAPTGASLTEHDGLPIRVNRKMIGVDAWRIKFREPAPPRERQIDRLRQAG